MLRKKNLRILAGDMLRMAEIHHVAERARIETFEWSWLKNKQQLWRHTHEAWAPKATCQTYKNAEKTGKYSEKSWVRPQKYRQRPQKYHERPWNPREKTKNLNPSGLEFQFITVWGSVAKEQFLLCIGVV